MFKNSNGKQLSFSNKILLIICLFIFLIFIRNFAFWSKSQTFIFGDTAAYALYLASLSKNIVSLFSFKDNFLAWNPSYLAVGLPTLSIIDLGVLYPPNILIALIAKILGNVMSVFPFYILSIFIHLALSSFFTFKILKVHWHLDDLSSLLGALIWIFTGFNLTHISASPLVLAGAYLPICVNFSLNLIKEEKQKDFFLLFIFLALSFLVGYPMVPLIILFVCGAIILFLQKKIDKATLIKSSKILIKGFFLVTLPIIAPLYFSAALNLSYTVRSPLLLEGFLSNPTQFSEVAESILPQSTFFNKLSTVNQTYLYFSLVGLILLIQAKDKLKILNDKKNIFMIIIGFLGLILSLGKVTSLANLTYFLVPAANLFRRLSVFSLITGFVFCLFVAQAIKPALENKKNSKILLVIITFLMFFLILSQAVTILSSSQKGTITFMTADQKSTPINITALQQSLGITLIILVLTLLTLKIYFYFPKTGALLLVFAFLLEAGITVSSRVFLNSKVNPEKVFGPNTLTDNLQNLVRPQERIDITGTQNCFSTDFLNLEQAQGYLSLASMYGITINDPLNNSAYNSKNLRDILGIKYLVRKGIEPKSDLERWSIISQNEKKPEFFVFNGKTSEWLPEADQTKFTIYKNPSSLPRVYLASKVRPSSQTKEVLKEIEKAENPKTVFIDRGNLKEETTQKGTEEILEYKRNYLKAKVKTDKLAFLANSTGYYPGWWARINGEFTKPIQANWFMMGVYLPKGENIVEFFYVPYGIIVGLLYLFGSLAFWFVRLRRKSLTRII